MDWSRAVNSYCERLDASFWSEPVNALSNVGFLLVAALVWRRLEVRSDPGARLLTLVLVAIGVGSFLFHTHAEVWAMLADVLPILGFILIYVHLATVRFLGAPVWGGALAAVAYVPASAMASRGIDHLAEVSDVARRYGWRLLRLPAMCAVVSGLVISVIDLVAVAGLPDARPPSPGEVVLDEAAVLALAAGPGDPLQPWHGSLIRCPSRGSSGRPRPPRLHTPSVPVA